MHLIGLTGGIATGKSTVGAELARLGATVIDADALAREVVEPGQAALGEIAARFGGDKLVGGEELTSVAWGLAARAREVFQ